VVKLLDLLNQILSEERKKADRCLRIARRKYDKSSAYRSGAIVRCRQGKIWKGLKEEENPPNIEYIKPNFEYEWEEAIRYPEFKKMGFDNWVKTAQKGYEVNFSDIKDKLKNVDLNFDSLNQDKKIRFINAFKTNQIELPIAVKFSENDYDLVGGNTRLSGLVRKGIDPKIWIVDLTTLKEDNQPSEGSYQQALKDIKPIIPVLSHNLIHQQSLEHNEENMVKLNQKIFDLVKKGDGTILDRLWDLAGNSLLKNAINIITFYHKSNLSEAKKETLRTWFKRKGAPGKTGGWVDCNSPIRKDGKVTGYKPCGRQKGEERAEYPSCRPTAARCKDKDKGTKWGKTK
jgi:hypothetical protein